MKDVIREVSRGLQDLSVSRPVQRLSWGIPVPDDKTQTIYVWLDALINYVTKAGYPFPIQGCESSGGWPADCHVIGKDIMRFHCIYWPAFLMALDLPLPKQIVTHAHWTVGREKMSKSAGIAVDPFSALDRFGVDCMRYYLAFDGSLKDDASYNESHITQRYDIGPRNQLGNLVNRITRTRLWQVKQAVNIAQSSGKTFDDEQLGIRLKYLRKDVGVMMANGNVGQALVIIMRNIALVCVWALLLLETH